MKKRNFIIVLVFWLIVIFLLSNGNNETTNNLSKGIVNKLLDILSHIEYFSFDDTKREIIINLLNPFLRKGAHIFEYFVLSLITFNLLKLFHLKKQKYYITIIFCFIYSLLDELHQTFIDGRDGKFSDCLIDTSGAILFLIIVIFLTNKKRKKMSDLKYH